MKEVKSLAWAVFIVGTALVFISLFSNVEIDKTVVFATGAALILVSLLIVYYSSKPPNTSL